MVIEAIVEGFGIPFLSRGQYAASGLRIPENARVLRSCDGKFLLYLTTANFSDYTPTDLSLHGKRDPPEAPRFMRFVIGDPAKLDAHRRGVLESSQDFPTLYQRDPWLAKAILEGGFPLHDHIEDFDWLFGVSYHRSVITRDGRLYLNIGCFDSGFDGYRKNIRHVLEDSLLIFHDEKEPDVPLEETDGGNPP